MKCRFCAAAAVAVFALDQGCFCHPDDREQALCCQHVVRASPIGSMMLVKVLDVDVWEWFERARGGR